MSLKVLCFYNGGFDILCVSFYFGVHTYVYGEDQPKLIWSYWRKYQYQKKKRKKKEEINPKFKEI